MSVTPNNDAEDTANYNTGVEEKKNRAEKKDKVLVDAELWKRM